MIMIVVPLCIIAVTQIPAILATRFARNENVRNTVPAIPVPVQEASPPALPHSDEETEAKVPDLPTTTEVTPTVEDTPTTVRAPAMADIQAIADTTVESQLDIQAEEHHATLPTVSEDIKSREQLLLYRNEGRRIWISRFRQRLGQANIYFPPLWMAGCVESIMSGTLHVYWLTVAMALVGFVSLRRNYRQTIRYYKGETDGRAISALRTSGTVAELTETLLAPAAPMRSDRRRLLVERTIPCVSEETAAVITMTLKSMTRAPEVKLYLLLPLIAPFILFGAMQAWQLPKIDELKAAIIVGFSACSLFITSGMLGNLFAYDRAGFRAFVLSPIRRDRILLGRNLATAPFLLLQTFLLALAIGIYFGMAIDKMLCALLLSASLLLVGTETTAFVSYSNGYFTSPCS